MHRRCLTPAYGRVEPVARSWQGVRGFDPGPAAIGRFATPSRRSSLRWFSGWLRRQPGARLDTNRALEGLGRRATSDGAGVVVPEAVNSAMTTALLSSGQISRAGDVRHGKSICRICLREKGQTCHICPFPGLNIWIFAICYPGIYLTSSKSSNTKLRLK